MADACAIAAVTEGATQIRCAAYPIGCASLSNVAHIISAKADTLDAHCNIAVTQISRIIDQINWLCNPAKGNGGALAVSESDDGVFLTAHDDEGAVSSAVKKLGYDISEGDEEKVYAAFRQIAERKEKVSLKELDAIVASSAMQVPSTYHLVNYVVNSGNIITATASVRLEKDGATIEGISFGDGPIDAAFKAIEQVTNRHYELEDFRIDAVTEGKEAIGRAIVKLRYDGRLYSGSGVSTDIIGAAIRAYLGAMNKIVYEEKEA
jgi:2-isopropylmalate synthase